MSLDLLEKHEDRLQSLEQNWSTLSCNMTGVAVALEGIKDQLVGFEARTTRSLDAIGARVDTVVAQIEDIKPRLGIIEKDRAFVIALGKKLIVPIIVATLSVIGTRYGWGFLVALAGASTP